MMKTNRLALVSALLVLTALPLSHAYAGFRLTEDPDKRAENAADVLNRMMAEQDQQIPKDLAARATCVVVIPKDQNFAWIFGYTYGRGLASCRTRNGWSLPSYVRSVGASWGLQGGGEIADEVLFLFGGPTAIQAASQKGLDLGGKLSATLIDGRNIDAQIDAFGGGAGIIGYSESVGLFGGVSLEAIPYGPDTGLNKKVYNLNDIKNSLSAEGLPSANAPTPAEMLLTTSLTEPSATSALTHTGMSDFVQALGKLPPPPTKAAQPASPAPAPGAGLVAAQPSPDLQTENAALKQQIQQLQQEIQTLQLQKLQQPATGSQTPAPPPAS